MNDREAHRLEEVLDKLNGETSKKVPGSRWMSQAAVAICMRQESPAAPIELLMILRSKKEGDPWSGHMAFPGGRIEKQDPDPLAAAIRESHEEIDLDLHTHATYAGPLSERPAIARVKIKPLIIYPYIFHLHNTPSFTFSDEVDEVVWIPLSFFLDEGQRTTMTYRKVGVSWELPCYHYDKYTVWGLSLQMIDEMLDRLRS